MIMPNVWFDTCVYHQPGMDLLFKVIDVGSLLFASEMLGAVRGKDPNTGFDFDDTKRYVDMIELADADRHRVFEGNARRVFPRLDQRLKARGK
jgi:4-oxalmesaconate hydratase